VLQGEKGLQVLTLFPGVKINQRADSPPMEDDVQDPVRKEKSVEQSGNPAGKKEEK